MHALCHSIRPQIIASDIAAGKRCEYWDIARSLAAYQAD